MSVPYEKPSLERITPSYGNSIMVKRYTHENLNVEPFWHFHPEMEIVYVNGGNGKRQIGNHLSFFQNGDLIFLGSNVPHYGFADKNTGYESETVVQMKSDFWGKEFLNLPEMSAIRNLFQRATKGIVINGNEKKIIGREVEKLHDLQGLERLTGLLKVLTMMANAREYELLNIDGFVVEILPQDTDRMNIVYKYLRNHFQRSIPLEQISDQVSMTVPAFCRYFKRMTNKTFTEFANEYRLVHASKLLLESSKSISEVCNESGFNNFSHFNKLFKRHHGLNPRDYRNSAKRMIVDE